MHEKLFLTGLGFIAVAIVGGGAELLGLKVTKLLNPKREAALGIFGLVLCTLVVLTPKGRRALFGSDDETEDAPADDTQVATPSPSPVPPAPRDDEAPPAVERAPTLTKARNNCAISDIVESCFDDEAACLTYLASRNREPGDSAACGPLPEFAWCRGAKSAWIKTHDVACFSRVEACEEQRLPLAARLVFGVYDDGDCTWTEMRTMEPRMRNRLAAVQ